VITAAQESNHQNSTSKKRANLRDDHSGWFTGNRVALPNSTDTENLAEEKCIIIDNSPIPAEVHSSIGS
jgi:hypothetical protein